MFLVKVPLKSKYSDFYIEKWRIQPQQTVEKGQVLCELISSEAKVDLQSPQKGAVLELLSPEGGVVFPGQAIAAIGQTGEKVPEKVLPQMVAEKSEAPAVITELKSPDIDKEAPVKAPEPKQAKTPAGPVVPILMPQAGQSMEEGTILSWKVKEGDTIEVGQIIMEIETDKATMEVEAVDGGRVSRIVVQAGETVDVKVPVAYLAEDDAAVDAYLAAQKSQGSAASAPVAQAAASSTLAFETTQSAAAVSETGRVKASPAARKLAVEKGISLASVTSGSGPGGRILTMDLANVRPSAVAPVAGGAKRIALSKMRKAIAQNLTYSKQNVPHFYARLTINAGPLYDTYQQTKAKFKCSLNDFITRACAKAIRQYAGFRSRYEGGEILEFPSVNIGIAVGTDQGLTVPVVLDADQGSPEELAKKTRGVVENARNGKLEGIGKGIFTISNLGMFGTEEFAAIINPPEAAILAVGAILEKPIVENGAIKVGKSMTMTLSVDHRVIDGVLAAQFLQTMKELLENPQSLAE